MLLGILEYMAVFYYWTWFVWPFAFVFGLAFGIEDLVKNEKSSGKGLIVAGAALMIMLSPVMWTTLRG